MSGILRGLDALAERQQRVFAVAAERQERELAALSRRTDEAVYPVWVQYSQWLEEKAVQEEKEEGEAREREHVEEQQFIAWPNGGGHLEQPSHHHGDPFWPLGVDEYSEESNGSGTWDEHEDHLKILFGLGHPGET